MINIDTELKRWSIFDTFTNKIYNITDSGFAEGLQNNFLKLKGQYIENKYGHNVWIDAITKK